MTAIAEPAVVETEEPGWEEVYEEMAGGLVALGVRRYHLSHEDCEDALQHAAQDAALSPGVRNRRGYLTTVFMRRCWKIRQAKIKHPEVRLEDGPEPSHDPSAAIITSLSFRRAMGGLPGRCREVITAWALADRNAQATARELSLSPRTIYVRIERCVKRLLNALS